MIQDFTFFFFANITASCQQKKNRQEKRNKIRSEWSTSSFQSHILRHSIGILKHLNVSADKQDIKNITHFENIE